jgi:hypothetical protein
LDSLNHLTVPVAIIITSLSIKNKKVLQILRGI